MRDTLWRLIVSTVGTCFRNRVTGLAAEAAFFALLSLPPLLFGLAGSIGYVFENISPDQVEQVRQSILEVSSRALTPQTVDAIVRPTLNDVFAGGRFDVISVGFILALWSGSRALNVFVETITIMYGLGGHRGIVQDPGAVVLPLRHGPADRCGDAAARRRGTRAWCARWCRSGSTS